MKFNFNLKKIKKLYEIIMSSSEPKLDEMNMSDMVAMFAMQGLIHHFDFHTFSNDPMRLAGWSYDAADAFLKERARRMEKNNVDQS